jgi:RNA polymerase sigma factor for flagellar operon FliA
MKTAGIASQQLVEQGQQLVYQLAMEIRRKIPFRVDMEDLVAYGQVGLAEAARDFDETRGASFITYAYYRVRGAIYDGVSNMSWTSRAFHRKLRYQRVAEETLCDEAVENPGEPQSLRESARWFSALTQRLAVVYLATQCGEKGLSESSIKDSSALPPPAIAAAREISERLRKLVDDLPPLTGRLIRLIYFEGTSLREAAERLSVSKSWASRLHAQTLEQLARSLRRLGEEGFRGNSP